MTLTLATATRNAKADAAVGRLNIGTGPGLLRIYTGPRPAGPGTAASGTLLAEVVLADPAGPAAVDGVVTMTNPGEVTAVGNGTAAWCRFLSSDAVAAFDGDVTVDGGGGEVTFPTLTFSTGLVVDMGSITYTQPA